MMIRVLMIGIAHDVRTCRKNIVFRFSKDELFSYSVSELSDSFTDSC